SPALSPGLTNTFHEHGFSARVSNRRLILVKESSLISTDARRRRFVGNSAMDRCVAALKHGTGLHDDFIYSMSFDDYRNSPDPFDRVTFKVTEVQARIARYHDPDRRAKLFEWDIHGRLFEPAKASIGGIAVVMIHGGAANEYEFIFTPDG